MRPLAGHFRHNHARRPWFPSTGSIATGSLPLFAHARFKHIDALPAQTDATSKVFMAAHYSDMQNGVFADFPNADYLATYCLFQNPEIDTGAAFTAGNGGSWTSGSDGSTPAGAWWYTWGPVYCAASGGLEEDLWLHCYVGQKNKYVECSTITADGSASFRIPNPQTAFNVQTPPTSFPFNKGDVVTLGTHGQFTITCVQNKGLTLSGWTSGTLATPGAVYVAGDGSKTKANRYRVFAWTEWRGFANPSSSLFKNFGVWKANTVVDHYTGSNAVFYDEMDSGHLNTSWNSVEYGTGSSVPYYADVATCLSLQSASLATRTDRPYIVRINNAAYQTANDTANIHAAGGTHEEDILAVAGYQAQSDIDYCRSLINGGYYVECVPGVAWSAANPGSLIGNRGASPVGNYPDGTARLDMSMYCWYLMAVDSSSSPSYRKKAIFCNDNSNNSGVIPLSARWSPAFEVNIGQPYSVWASNYTRNTGSVNMISASVSIPKAAVVLNRQFTLDGTTTTASAYFNTVHGDLGAPNFTATSTGNDSLMTGSFPALPPGAIGWYMLNRDGTLSGSASPQWQVRNGEGSIWIAVQGAGANGIQAFRADAFVDSMGTNIHMDATPYTSMFSNVVIPAMLDLGIRVCRSGCFGTGSDAAIAFTNTLYKEAGTQYILVSNPVGSTLYSNMGIQQYMFSQIDPTSCLVIEGPNEVDNNNSNWGGQNHYGDNVFTFMNALVAWRNAHADPRVNAVKISTPTVTSNFGAVNLTHSFAFCDYGMAHPYTLPAEPGGQLASLLNAVAPTWGGSGSLPVLISETGFECAESASSPSYLIGTGVNNIVQAKYLQRQYFENFSQGVLKTCHYELMDDGTDYTIGEQAWGLMNSVGNQKLSYQYIKNTIALLRERSYNPPSSSVGNGDLIFDDFNRVSANGWGAAPLGSDVNKTYADGDGNESGQWQVSQSAGQTKLVFQVRQKIGDSHNSANEVEWHFSNYKRNYSQLMRTYVRHTDFQNTYQANTNGGVGTQLSIEKVIGGSTTNLASVSKTEISSMISGSIIFRVVPSGSDNYLYLKAWNSTGSVPTAWDLTAIDVGANSTIVSGGAFGLWVDENSSGQKIHTNLFKCSTVSASVGNMPALSVFTPTKLDYTLTVATGSVKSCLFQKADSSFWLALWNRANSYAAGNPGSQNVIVPVSCSITIATGSRTATVYQPGVSQVGTGLGTSGSFKVMVPDEVILLQIV